MRVFDVDDKYLGDTEDEEFIGKLDLDKGYLEEDEIFKEHHDAIPEKKREFHYAVTCVYFEDGTKYEPEGEDDPRIATDDVHSGRFEYIFEDGEEPKSIRGMDLKEVEDSPNEESKDEWDEYEQIQRYKAYTEDEYSARKEAEKERAKRDELLASGLNRIVELEEAKLNHEERLLNQNMAIGDATEMALTANQGVDRVEPVVEETSIMVEDMVLILADIVGGEEMEEE